MTEQPQFDEPFHPTIEECVRQHAGYLLPSARRDLVAALVAREEAIADVMRMAGQQFGLLPQIVAEVFAQIGFGEPISTEQRVLIHNQFHQVIEQIQRGEDPFAQPDNNN